MTESDHRSSLSRSPETHAIQMRQTQRYVLLDGMRGVAAIAVLLYHLAWQTGLEKILFAHAYLAVDFFFMLSGFVLADAYDRRLSTGLMTGAAFVKVRIIRLFPMIVLGTMFGLGVRLAMIWAGWAQENVSSTFVAFAAGLVLEPILLVPGTGLPEFRFPLNEPLWSLFWEMVANLSYAALTIRCPNQEKAWRIWSILGGAFAVFLFVFALTHNGLDRGHREVLGGLLRVGFAFSAGVMIWHKRMTIRVPSIPAVLQIVILILVLACPRLPHVNALYDLIVVLMVFPALIASASRTSVGGRAASAATWAGAISYPLYALHDPFMALIDVNRDWLAPGRAAACATVFGVAIVVVAASFVIMKYVDEPVRRRLTLRFATRPAPRAQTAP